MARKTTTVPAGARRTPPRCTRPNSGEARLPRSRSPGVESATPLIAGRVTGLSLEERDLLPRADPSLVDGVECAVGRDLGDGPVDAFGERTFLLEHEAHLVDLGGDGELANHLRLRIGRVEVLDLGIAHEDGGLEVHDQAVDLAVGEGLKGHRVIAEDLGLGGRLDDVLDELEAPRLPF